MIHFIEVRRNYQYALLLVLALIASSCSEDIPPAEQPPAEDLKGVFISGTGRNREFKTAATYWHDGTPTNLSAVLGAAIVYNTAGSGMIVSGSDVYVCGVLYTSQGNFPAYWKNGGLVMLTPGNGYATDIVVIDNKVYVSGTLETGTGDGHSYGVLWKDGVISYITEGTTYSSATTVMVSGQNVYVGGNIVKDNKTYACYWKNGTPHLLTSGDSFAYVSTLALVGETVYAAGSDSGNPVGKYWKNDEAVNLTDGTSKVEVSTIHINGSDVYVAGRRQTGAAWELVVWKNDNIVITSPSNGFILEVGKIAIKSNDVLVTGSIIYLHADSNIHADATLWTNGVPETLSQGADGVNEYGGYSIVVK